MKHVLKWMPLLLALATLAITFSGSTPAQQRASSSPAQVSVYFSPQGGAQEAVIAAINAAQQSVLVQAYSFTSAPIAEALVSAHRRGVKVEAVLDKSNQSAQYSGATFLSNAGVQVLIDSRHAIAHNKIMLIDSGTPEAVIVTGSFNFTRAAQERNAENLLVLSQCPQLVRSYAANYQAHRTHSRQYTRSTPEERR